MIHSNFFEKPELFITGTQDGLPTILKPPATPKSAQGQEEGFCVRLERGFLVGCAPSQYSTGVLSHLAPGQLLIPSVLI